MFEGKTILVQGKRVTLRQHPELGKWEIVGVGILGDRLNLLGSELAIGAHLFKLDKQLGPNHIIAFYIGEYQP